jgi:hypothetical protein
VIINVVDKSESMPDDLFSIAWEACRIQLIDHVMPLWTRGPVDLVMNGPEDVGCQIVVMDDADQAGLLGYHTKTPNGKSWGRVFVRRILESNPDPLVGSKSVSAIMSHEIVEAYCDPDVNLWARRRDGMLVAYEAVDPVEGDFYEVETSGRRVSVSNFVTPAWFDPMSPDGTRFDHMGHVKKSFGISHGGYAVVLSPKSGIAKNVYGSLEAHREHVDRQEPYVAARSSRKLADNMTADDVIDSDESW